MLRSKKVLASALTRLIYCLLLDLQSNMNHRIDIDELRLEASLSANAQGSTMPRKRRLAQPFLKGPVPWVWLTTAARLPGKALHVGVYLWRMVGMAGAVPHKLTMQDLEAFGVKYDAGYDALKRLEEAGLVTVVRHRGRKPIVTIVMPQEWPTA